MSLNLGNTITSGTAADLRGGVGFILQGIGKEACVKKKPFHGERHRLDEMRKRGDGRPMSPFQFLVLSLPKDQPYFIMLTSIR